MTMEKLFRQIGDEVVEYTANEYAQVQLDKQEAETRRQAEADKAAEKQLLLNQLGITADQAKLLLS